MVLVDWVMRRNTGATRSGRMVQESFFGPLFSASSIWAMRRSGSMMISPVSTVAAPAMAAAMMRAWVMRDSTRASIRLSRDWLK